MCLRSKRGTNEMAVGCAPGGKRGCLVLQDMYTVHMFTLENICSDLSRWSSIDRQATAFARLNWVS